MSEKKTLTPVGLEFSLNILAAVSIVGGLVVFVAYLLQFVGQYWYEGLWFLVLGFAAGVLFWAVAWLVAQQRESLRTQRRIVRLLSDGLKSASPDRPQQSSPPGTSSAGSGDEGLAKLSRQLAELNANLLLTDEQRRVKQEEWQSEQAEKIIARIDHAMDENNFDQAEQLLEEFEHHALGDPRIEDRRAFIRTERQNRAKAIIEENLQRATDLMSVARFGEAIDLAEKLKEQFPDSPQAVDLLERVRRETDAYQSEQRGRLYAIIHEHGETRQWKSALQAAHKLVETYSDSPEADEVRSLMPMLVDNTRIQEVREFRDRILDLMDRRRYSEAVKLAGHVVENYPETAAAEELRRQMPQLQELAQRSKQGDRT
jgi:tetratricopeptide (TPR) repeat protein